MQLSGKKVLITGGAGFIGSHLLDRLAATGNHVTVIDNFCNGKDANVRHHRGNPVVRIERADICDYVEVDRVMRGVDVVFHMAVCCARTSAHDPFQAAQVNAAGSLNVCEAARRHRIGRLIYVSTIGVYGDAAYWPIDEKHPLEPANMYGSSKAAGEMYARSYWRTYDVPTAIIRLSSTYGPREPSEGRRAEVIPKFVMRILAGERPVIYGTGEQTRDFTYVDDIVAGLLLAAECDAMVGECVNLGRGQDVSVGTVCRLIMQKLGRPDLEPIFIPNGSAPERDRAIIDVRKAAQMFGFSAPVDIDAGLDAYIRWVREQDVDLERWLEQDRTAQDC